jgi:hypothetical protein
MDKSFLQDLIKRVDVCHQCSQTLNEVRNSKELKPESINFLQKTLVHKLKKTLMGGMLSTKNILIQSGGFDLKKFFPNLELKKIEEKIDDHAIKNKVNPLSDKIDALSSKVDEILKSKSSMNALNNQEKEKYIKEANEFLKLIFLKFQNIISATKNLDQKLKFNVVKISDYIKTPNVEESTLKNIILRLKIIHKQLIDIQEYLYHTD